MAYIGRTPTGSILTGADIADGSISTAKLADTAVSTAKIADDAVGNTKLNLASDYAFTGDISGTPYDAKLFHLQHIEASSADGGGASNTSNNQRTLNSTVVNQISGASVSSNDVTLPAGTYIIDGYANAFRANRHFLRWYNSTDTTYVINGQSTFCDGNNEVQNLATISGRFTISAQKTFALMHYTQDNASGQTNCLGVSSGVTTNHYVNLRIWKVA